MRAFVKLFARANHTKLSSSLLRFFISFQAYITIIDLWIPLKIDIRSVQPKIKPSSMIKDCPSVESLEIPLKRCVFDISSDGHDGWSNFHVKFMDSSSFFLYYCCRWNFRVEFNFTEYAVHWMAAIFVSVVATANPFMNFTFFFLATAKCSTAFCSMLCIFFVQDFVPKVCASKTNIHHSEKKIWKNALKRTLAQRQRTYIL